MSTKNALVGTFENHSDAEESIKELQSAGYDMKKLSIIGKDFHTEEHVVGYYNTGDRMAVWGKLGAFWGGLWGLLFGSALFFIPTIGPLVVFGPLVGWMAGALEGAVVVGGFSAIGAALFSIGIPKDSIIQYESSLKYNKFILIAHGSAEEVLMAKNILETNGSARIAVHEGIHNDLAR